MVTVTTFYKFFKLTTERVGEIKDELMLFCEARNIRGLLLLGTEGCNATMAGEKKAIDELKAHLQEISEVGALVFKDSTASKQPFKRLKIDIREEIVTLKRPDIYPENDKNCHLTPTEWDNVLKSNDDFVLIDTRNIYETEMGMFKGAVDPRINHFSEFPAFVQSQNYPKEKKILMYCTGGIRCEKALVYMQQEGFSNVYQLDGGILNYFKEVPDGAFEGECFVFDHRVALDKELNPTSSYTLCPHCGNPAKEKIVCLQCGTEKNICSSCAKTSERNTCSKNCAHHEARAHGRTATGSQMECP